MYDFMALNRTIAIIKYLIGHNLSERHAPVFWIRSIAYNYIITCMHIDHAAISCLSHHPERIIIPELLDL